MKMWVRVITVNPLKGPCEGQVQVLITWLRKPVSLSSGVPRVFYRNKTYHVPAHLGPFVEGSLHHKYISVQDNFGRVDPEHVMIDRKSRQYWNLPEKSEPLALTQAAMEEILSKPVNAAPPKLYVYSAWFGDDNDRRHIGDFIHWDSFVLLDTVVKENLKHHYARQALRDQDGDDYAAYASWTVGQQAVPHYISVERQEISTDPHIYGEW